MRILIVGKNCYSGSHRGHAVWPTLAGHTLAFTLPLVEYLLGEGHKVAFVAPWKPAAGDCLLEGIEIEPPPDLVLRYVDDPPFRKIPLGCSALDLILGIEEASHELGGPDWIFFVYAFPTFLFAQDCSSVLGCKAAIFLRGGDGYKFLFPDALETALGVTRGRLLAALYLRSLRRADCTFAVSRWLAGRVEKVGVTVSGIVPSPAVSSTYPLAVMAIPKRQRKIVISRSLSRRVQAGVLRPQKKWLITAGRLSSDKCLSIALAAFEQWSSDSWQLLICGAGPEEAAVVNEIRHLGLDDVVCVLRLSPAELAGVLSCGDAYLHSSLPHGDFVDARPSAVTSAAYYGLPVVFPRGVVGGVGESLSDENRRLLAFRWTRSQRPSRSIVRVLRHLDDPEVCALVGRSNRRLAKRFAATTIFPRLIEELRVRA